MRHVCDESKLRLDGLNKALNNAIEEEAKTRAYLDTLREAIAGGAQVVPSNDRRDVEAMGEELRELQVILEASNRAKLKDICDRVIKNCNYDFGKSTKHIRISL
jgi:hypothetical protein